MLTVVTTRPPSTYTFTTSLQFISILEKLHFLLLHVESDKFLLPVSFFKVIVPTSSVANATSAIATGGC